MFWMVAAVLSSLLMLDRNRHFFVAGEKLPIVGNGSNIHLFLSKLLERPHGK